MVLVLQIGRTEVLLLLEEQILARENSKKNDRKKAKQAIVRRQRNWERVASFLKLWIVSFPVHPKQR
jgi:hypothetical protein